MLSIPGSSLRFSCAISNSYSKSEIARNALDDRVGAVFAGELDQQGGEDLHLDVGERCGRFLDERLALVRREQGPVLAQRVVDDADDDLVEDIRGAGDDVDVPEGDRS